jgi:hypothetical protein
MLSIPWRLPSANLLELLDARPGARPLTPVRGDEGVKLGAGKLGHVGADRLPDKRGTLHDSNLAPASCRKRVRTLRGSRI